MPDPRREEFILDVRRSARALQQPDVEADSERVDTDAVSRILDRAALWLSPKVVALYAPEDFADCQSEQQQRLRLAVDGFREIARQVPANQPATVEQFTAGAERFRELIKVLGGIVLEEWLHAIDAIEHEAEAWARDAEWRTRRVNKKLSESLIGAYNTTQLLIFAEPNLYVLDPVARFAPGCQGVFDFAIQPSYSTASMYRDDAGVWHVHPDFTQGTIDGQPTLWNRDAFLNCIQQLEVLV